MRPDDGAPATRDGGAEDTPLSISKTARDRTECLRKE